MTLTFHAMVLGWLAAIVIAGLIMAAADVIRIVRERNDV